MGMVSSLWWLFKYCFIVHEAFHVKFSEFQK